MCNTQELSVQEVNSSHCNNGGSRITIVEYTSCWNGAMSKETERNLIHRKKSGTRWDSNPRPSERYSDALTTETLGPQQRSSIQAACSSIMWRPQPNARYYCHSYECDACEHSSFKCGCFHPTITVLHIVFWHMVLLMMTSIIWQ